MGFSFDSWNCAKELGQRHSAGLEPITLDHFNFNCFVLFYLFVFFLMASSRPNCEEPENGKELSRRCRSVRGSDSMFDSLLYESTNCGIISFWVIKLTKCSVLFVLLRNKVSYLLKSSFDNSQSQLSKTIYFLNGEKFWYEIKTETKLENWITINTKYRRAFGEKNRIIIKILKMAWNRVACHRWATLHNRLPIPRDASFFIRSYLMYSINHFRISLFVSCRLERTF